MGVLQGKHKRRPSTRANPAPEEPIFSDDEEDEILPVYWFRDPSRDQVPPLQSQAQCGPEISTQQEGHGLMFSFDPPDHLVESPPNVQRVDLPEDDHTPVRPDYTVDVPLVPDDHPTDVVQLATGVAAPAESVRLTGSDCPNIQSDDVPDTTTDTETVRFFCGVDLLPIDVRDINASRDKEPAVTERRRAFRWREGSTESDVQPDLKLTKRTFVLDQS
ncbi:hypothetical protein D9C73_006023 [Collichthys lucidus]|uniref:Uncharacterized protein n=1 Tax=Collichthys lucidus TaxID=240159 RepID=A0A4U5UD63_COLLU|nr:hypothetical protein D9C73_006023 [Collichthys lucidus]